MVENEGVLFDSQGNEIVLAMHTDSANLGKATKKSKFKNTLEHEIPYSVNEETQRLLWEGAHIAVYKSSRHILDTYCSADEFEPRSQSPDSPKRQDRKSILCSTERQMKMLKH